MPRFCLAGIPQHVIQRGNNRQAIFVAPLNYVVSDPTSSFGLVGTRVRRVATTPEMALTIRKPI